MTTLKFDPLFYMRRPKYSKFTRMRAAAAALDAYIITLDAYISWMNYILNEGVD